MDWKDRFEQMSATPDEGVWSSVNDTLSKRRAARRVAGMTAAAVVAAVLVWGIAQRPSAVVSQEAQSASVRPVVSQVEVTAPTESAQFVGPVDNTVSAHGLEQNLVAANGAAQPVEMSAVATGKLEPTTTTTLALQEPQLKVAPPRETEPVAPNPTPTAVAASENGTSSLAQNAAVQPKVQPVNESEELCIWIPNAISLSDPNYENRHFRVVAQDASRVQNFKMFIYSRSGQQVFKSRDINESWNGTLNSQMMPMGAYVYVIEYYDALLDKTQTVRGTITLVR